MSTIDCRRCNSPLAEYQFENFNICGNCFERYSVQQDAEYCCNPIMQNSHTYYKNYCCNPIMQNSHTYYKND